MQAVSVVYNHRLGVPVLLVTVTPADVGAGMTTFGPAAEAYAGPGVDDCRAVGICHQNPAHCVTFAAVEVEIKRR